MVQTIISHKKIPESSDDSFTCTCTIATNNRLSATAACNLLITGFWCIVGWLVATVTLRVCLSVRSSVCRHSQRMIAWISKSVDVYSAWKVLVAYIGPDIKRLITCADCNVTSAVWICDPILHIPVAVRHVCELLYSVFFTLLYCVCMISGMQAWPIFSKIIPTIDSSLSSGLTSQFSDGFQYFWDFLFFFVFSFSRYLFSLWYSAVD